MYNKLISFGLLLSMLCTTNIVFGMQNNIIPTSEYTIHHVILEKDGNNNKYTWETLNRNATFQQSNINNDAPLTTLNGYIEITRTASVKLLTYFNNNKSNSEKHSHQLEMVVDEFNAISQKIENTQNYCYLEPKKNKTSLKGLVRIMSKKNFDSAYKNNQSSYSWLTLIGCGVGLAAIVATFFYFRR